MRRVWKALFAGVGALLLSAPGAFSEETGKSFALTGEETSIPYGWLDFCGRRPDECRVPELPAVELRLTAAARVALERINRRVNAEIKPISNLDHWGTIVDHWDYPVDGMGDCKIYALYKRKLLRDMGFPRQALLMTIVRDQNNQGHAILTVKTDRGDLILDNMTDDIRPWDATGYRFVKRQSQEDPNIWVAIKGPAHVAGLADAKGRALR
jgi:predicted transglutaminase-like cysteine proteinase